MAWENRILGSPKPTETVVSRRQDCNPRGTSLDPRLPKLTGRNQLGEVTAFLKLRLSPLPSRDRSFMSHASVFVEILLFALRRLLVA